MAFNKVQVKVPSSNTFNMSHPHASSGDFGFLIPVQVQECLPGDVWSLNSRPALRMQPMVVPVMHEVAVYVHHFFVPNRIVYADWEKFISSALNSETPPAWPYFNVTAAVTENSLSDYLGLPTKVANIGAVSCLPHACYTKIFNDYYRDENLVPEQNCKVISGLNTASNVATALQKRAWQHDYFTSALPFQQKGPKVMVPLGTFPDVDVIIANTTTAPKWIDAIGGARTGTATGAAVSGKSQVGGNDAWFDPSGTLQARTSLLQGSAASINDFRTAMRLQEFYEKAARGGSRYIEQLRMHFDVRSSDQRLQRAEFIGGTRQPVIISEVLQTAPATTASSGNTPQGNMAGHGISLGGERGFRKYCEEHGFIVSIMSVMPKTMYYQGIHRMFRRKSWEEYAWPTFAHLGEQPVYNYELYHSASDGQNDAIFGYQERYAEYRSMPARVSGQLAGGDLKRWTMAREFANRPALNRTFIECTDDSRIFAVTTGSKLIFNVQNNSYVRRKLPQYGTPAL